MRTIDADAALKALRKCQTYLYDARDPELKIELSSAEAAINNPPTIQPEKEQLSKEGTTSDLISRTATIDAVNNAFDRETLLTGFVRSIAVRAIRDMPSAQPVATDINVGDTISRQAVLDAVEKNACNTQRIMDAVNNLPSAQPEPQWILCNERMPKDGKYIVTIHGCGWNGKTFTSVSVAECIGKRWVGNNGVIAWIPLPKPYEGEGGQE